MGDPMTDERLAAIEASLSTVPPPPWVAFCYEGPTHPPPKGWHTHSVCRYDSHEDDGHVCITMTMGRDEPQAERVARFVAASRDTIADLVAEVRLLRAALDALGAALFVPVQALGYDRAKEILGAAVEQLYSERYAARQEEYAVATAELRADRAEQERDEADARAAAAEAVANAAMTEGLAECGRLRVELLEWHAAAARWVTAGEDEVLRLWTKFEACVERDALRAQVAELTRERDEARSLAGWNAKRVEYMAEQAHALSVAREETLAGLTPRAEFPSPDEVRTVAEGWGGVDGDPVQVLCAHKGGPAGTWFDTARVVVRRGCVEPQTAADAETLLDAFGCVMLAPEGPVSWAQLKPPPPPAGPHPVPYIAPKVTP